MVHISFGRQAPIEVTALRAAEEFFVPGTAGDVATPRRSLGRPSCVKTPGPTRESAKADGDPSTSFVSCAPGLRVSATTLRRARVDEDEVELSVEGGGCARGWQTTALLLICEGPPDALVAAQAGFRSVGILGNQAPDERIATALATHAERSGDRLVAVLDADDGGEVGVDRLTELLAKVDCGLTVVDPPEGLDLNDWALVDASWAQSVADRALPGRAPKHAVPDIGDALGVTEG